MTVVRATQLPRSHVEAWGGGKDREREKERQREDKKSSRRKSEISLINFRGK